MIWKMTITYRVVMGRCTPRLFCIEFTLDQTTFVILCYTYVENSIINRRDSWDNRGKCYEIRRYMRFEVLQYNMNLLPMSNIYCCYVYTCSVSVYKCLKVVLWPRLFWTCSNRLPRVITCCDERNKSATISTMNPARVRLLNLYGVVVQTSETRAKSTCLLLNLIIILR